MGLPATVSPGSSLTSAYSVLWILVALASADSALSPHPGVCWAPPGPLCLCQDLRILQAGAEQSQLPPPLLLFSLGSRCCLMSSVWRVLVLLPSLSCEEVVFYLCYSILAGIRCPRQISREGHCSSSGDHQRPWVPRGCLLGRPQAAPVLGWAVGSIPTKGHTTLGKGLLPGPQYPLKFRHLLLVLTLVFLLV